MQGYGRNWVLNEKPLGECPASGKIPLNVATICQDFGYHEGKPTVENKSPKAR